MVISSVVVFVAHERIVTRWRILLHGGREELGQATIDGQVNESEDEQVVNSFREVRDETPQQSTEKKQRLQEEVDEVGDGSENDADPKMLVE
jgi:hypothetical protein